jgi:hypothetical protein
MRSPVLACLAAAVAIGGVLCGPSAVAATTTATCATGEFCVWSGTGYTGTMVRLDLGDWHGCVTAAELGLPSIRSASKVGVACAYQASLHADGACGQGTDPSFVQPQTPDISPAALSLDRFLIPC